MSAKPSIPARPSAKPTIPQRPSVRSKPAAPARPSASAKRAAVVGASKVPSMVPGAKVAAKSSASQRTPSHARGVAKQGNRTPVGRSGPQSLPTLNPVAVVVADAAVGVSRSPQPSLLPPAESVPRVRTEASGPQEASGRAVVKVARVKRGKSSDGANSKRVGPSGLPGAQAFKPKQPPGIGAVTASEINLLLEMDTNSKAKKQLMQKKQVAAEAADTEELIARSMNGVVMKTGWEKPAEANSLSAKMQKELDRLEREKSSAEDAEKWKELENQRLLHLKTMLETSRQVNRSRLAELEQVVAALQSERDAYYASCQALEQQCRSVVNLLDDGDALLSKSLA